MNMRILPVLASMGAIGLGAVAAPPVNVTPPPDGGKFPLTPPEIDVDAALDSDVRGRLAIRAVQGTPDGPPVGAAAITVQLVHQGMVVFSYEEHLDEHGVLMLEDLPIAMGVTPVVEVAHAGVTYRQSAPMISPAQPEQMVEVVCYEVTDAAPDWTVQMRHVMLTAGQEGLRVNEILQIENPAPRTWLGLPQPEGKPRTTFLPLSEGAHAVQLGRGFHDWCCTTFGEGTLVNHLPLMPEVTEMEFSYHVPTSDGAAVLDIEAPVPVKHLMVIVPESIGATPIAGLEAAGGSTIGETRVNFFVATDLPADERSSVALTRLGGSAGAIPRGGAGPAADARKESVSIAKVIAAIGGGMLVLVAVVIMLSRPARPASPS